MPKNCVKCGILANQECSRCKAPYCSAKCQYEDWKIHGVKCIQAQGMDDFDDIPFTPNTSEESDDEFIPRKQTPMPTKQPEKLTYDALEKKFLETFTAPQEGETFGDWMKRWPEDLRDKDKLAAALKKNQQIEEDRKFHELELLIEYQFSTYRDHESTTIEEKEKMRALEHRIDRVARHMYSQTKTGKNMTDLLYDNQLIIEKLIFKALRVFNFCNETDAPMTRKERAAIITQARVDAEKAFPSDIKPDGTPSGEQKFNANDLKGDETDNVAKTIAGLPKDQVPIPGLASVMQRLKLAKRLAVPNITEDKQSYPFFTLVKDNGEFTVVDRDTFNDFQKRTRDLVHEQLLPTNENFVKAVENAWYEPEKSPFRQVLSEEYQNWRNENLMIAGKFDLSDFDDTPPSRPTRQRSPKRTTTPTSSAPKASSLRTTTLRPTTNKPSTPNPEEYSPIGVFDEFAETTQQWFASKIPTFDTNKLRNSGVSKRTQEALETVKKVELSKSAPSFRALWAVVFFVIGACIAFTTFGNPAIIDSPLDLISDVEILNREHSNLLFHQYEGMLDLYEQTASQKFLSETDRLSQRMYQVNTTAVVDFQGPKYFFGQIAYNGGFDPMDPNQNIKIANRVLDYIQFANVEELNVLRQYFSMELLIHHSVSFIPDKPSGFEVDEQKVIASLEKLQILRSNQQISSDVAAVSTSVRDVTSELATLVPSDLSQMGLRRLSESLKSACMQVQYETSPTTQITELREIVDKQAREYFIFTSNYVTLQYNYWNSFHTNIENVIEDVTALEKDYQSVLKMIKKLRQENAEIPKLPPYIPPHVASFNAFLLRNESTRELYSADLTPQNRQKRDDLFHEWVMVQTINFPNTNGFFNQDPDVTLAYNIALRRGVPLNSSEDIEQLTQRLLKQTEPDRNNIKSSRFYEIKWFLSWFKSFVLMIWDTAGSTRFNIAMGGTAILNLHSLWNFYTADDLENANNQNRKWSSFAMNLLTKMLVGVGIYTFFQFVFDQWTNIVYIDNIAQEYETNNPEIENILQLPMTKANDWKDLLTKAFFSVASISNFDWVGFFGLGSQISLPLYFILNVKLTRVGRRTKLALGSLIQAFSWIWRKKVLALAIGILTPIGVNHVTRSTISTSVVVQNARAFYNMPFEYNAGMVQPAKWIYTDDYNMIPFVMANQQYFNAVNDILPQDRDEALKTILRMLDISSLNVDPAITPRSMPLERLMADDTSTFKKMLQETEFWKVQLKKEKGDKVQHFKPKDKS